MTAVRQKLKERTQTETQVSIESLATEYLDLETQIAKIQKKLSPLEQQQAALKKQIIEAANAALDADEELVLPINGMELKIGKRGSSRTIMDLEKAIEYLGVDTFLRVAKIGLADLDKYCRPEEIEQCVTSQRTDTRILKVRV